MRFLFALLSAFVIAAPAVAQQRAPEHRAEYPGLISGQNGIDGFASGPELQRGRPAKEMLAEQRLLTKTLATLAPQRPKTVDAYVIAAALDSDPVFSREAREAGKVLSRRFDAVGRTIVLAGPDNNNSPTLPDGSLTSLTLALARVAEVMDKNQDVLVLYTTSHGAKVGIAYHDGDNGYGLLSPQRLAGILDELGIKNRVLILSACYSGIFVPRLLSENTAIFTAASSEKPSFGCMAENDWTFFGDAMINHALRKAQPLDKAGDEARGLIDQWESSAQLQPSSPQVSIGDKVSTWLTPLEARMPKVATAPVGRPATDALKGG